MSGILNGLKNPWVLIGVIAVVLVGGSIWYSMTVNEQSNEGVTAVAHIKGNPKAAVTLVEYSDFQCPACAQFQPVVAEIMEAYGDSILFEYKHFPLMQIHPLAESAARAAEAAGQQGKFFEFHDALFENQTTWAASANPAQYFTKYAEELELDMNLFNRHLRSSVLRDKVRAEFSEARGLGLTGTPSFFLNGVKMEINTFDDFKTQIEAAIGINPAGTDTSATPAVEFGI